MSENYYEIIFEQIQPLHLGFKKHGVVSETKIFIPGQTIWGALVNSFIKKDIQEKDKIKIQEIQKMFENISCFFPIIKNGDNFENVLTPEYKDGELYLGDYSERKFRYYFTDTFVSTAVNTKNREAVEGSLHEIDYILPNKKDKIKEKLFWKGYLKINDETIKDFIKECESIYVGGEVKYGFGLIKCSSINKIDCTKNIFFKEKEKEFITYNFIEYDNKIKFEGKLELIREYNFYDKIGIDIKYYIKPGSKIFTSPKNYTLKKGKITTK